MRTANKSLIVTSFVAALAMGGCADSGPLETASVDPLLLHLRELGFSEGDIIDEGAHFLVEGDMEVPKEWLREVIAKKEPGRPSFAYALGGWSQGSYAHNYASSIAVDLSSLNAHPRWRAAVVDAMGIWSSIPGAGVSLYNQAGTGNPTRITIHTYTESCGPGDAIAKAQVGTPGNSVKVNLGCLAVLSDAVLLHAAVHEFGHNLGFKHSDESPCSTWASIADWFGFYTCASHVPGTPTWDDQSVMARFARPWSGFTENDRYASRFLFQGFGPPASGYLSGSTAVVTWNPVLDAQAYEVYRAYPFVNAASLMWDYNYVLAGTTTATSFADAQVAAGPCSTPHPSIPASVYVVRALFRNNVATWFGLQGFCASF